MRTIVVICALGLLSACASLPDALAQAPAGAPVSRGIERLEKVPHYRRCWGVVIGINYSGLTGAARAEVPRLRTAENDAKIVYDRLIANYGFTPETTRLLVGDGAKLDDIRQLFGKNFLGNHDQVTADDCVLVYFAGHGDRTERTSDRGKHVGLIYPADVGIVPGQGVDTVSCLRIVDDVLNYLKDYCAARHKLVIFDSCHSGEVFNFQTYRSSSVNRAFRDTLFSKPTFQALAAARSDQVAADADEDGKHSPVTRALLEALGGAPAFENRKFFTASELFSFIVGRVSKPGARQDPKGGWISGEGDFYFFPMDLKPGDFPAEEIAAWKSRRSSADSESKASPAWYANGPLVLAVVGGAVVLPLVSVLFLMYRRKSSAGQAAVPSGAVSPGTDQITSAAPQLLMMLRVVGTPCIYQTPANTECITVGRQRRKPGLLLGDGNDLIIRSVKDEDCLKISRRHFEIQRRGQILEITDRSGAGTWLNGQRLERNLAVPLKPEDTIDIAGVIKLQFILDVPLLGPVQKARSLSSFPGFEDSPLLLEATVGDLGMLLDATLGDLGTALAGGPV